MIIPFYYIDNKWCFFQVIIKNYYYSIECNEIPNHTISEMITNLFDNSINSDNMLVLMLNNSNKKYKNYCYYNVFEKRYYEFKIDMLIIVEIEDVCYEFDNYDVFLNSMTQLYKYNDYIEVQVEKME